jgi:recombination protein RecT
MTTAIEKKPASTGTLKQILTGDAFKGAVAKALPKHLPPDRFLRIAQTAMTRTPKLNECDQASFLGALLTLSALGLEPDGRRAHLIPFNNRKRGCVECQLIIDWKGLAELAMRSGVISYLHADVVCEGDVFKYSAGELAEHIPWFLRRDDNRPEKPGEIYAVYALARFKDGSAKCDVMSIGEVDAIRARSRSADDGPWKTDFNEMAKKTAFRRLSKWLPLSSEFRDALDVDAEQTPDAAPIQVFSRVEASNFALPEAQAEQLPPPSSPPEDATHEETNKESAPTQTASIKDQLAGIVTQAGYSFDDFRSWAVECGSLTKQEADFITSFEEIPQAKAATFVKNRAGMLKQLGMLKGAAV